MQTDTCVIERITVIICQYDSRFVCKLYQALFALLVSLKYEQQELLQMTQIANWKTNYFPFSVSVIY